MSVLWQGAKSKNFKRFEKLCCDLFNVIRKNANLFINMMSLVSTQHNKHNNKPTASATQQPQATAASNSRNSTQCDIPRHDKRHTTPYDSTPYDRATQHVLFQLQHCCAVPFVIIPLRGCPLTSPRCRLLCCLACCLPACMSMATAANCTPPQMFPLQLEELKSQADLGYMERVFVLDQTDAEAAAV